MLSRVADSIYWMARYLERAENVARFILVNLNLSLDMPAGSQPQWFPLVVTTGDDEPFKKRYAQATKENVIDFLTFDAQNPNSILSCLTAARENARSVREALSSEMWESINRFYLMVRDAGSMSTILQNPHGFFNAVTTSGQAFIGVTDTTMTHGESWHFCRVGRLLERADKTSRILDVKYYILLPNVHDVGTPIDDVQWVALLRSASAFEMYRQRHGRISPHRVVEFLMLDAEFPRAVLYCLTKANESLHHITGTPMGTFTNLAEQRLGHQQAELAFTRPEEIIHAGLHEYVDELQLRLNRVGEAIQHTFFDLRPVESSPMLAKQDA